MNKSILGAFVLFVFVWATAAVAQNKVVVVPLGGDVTNLVISPSSIVSAVGRFGANETQTDTFYTVPNDKTFVLTDFITTVNVVGTGLVPYSAGSGDISNTSITAHQPVIVLRNQDGNKASIPIGNADHRVFKSGIVFRSGSEIYGTTDGRKYPNGTVYFTISGFLY